MTPKSKRGIPGPRNRKRIDVAHDAADKLASGTELTEREYDALRWLKNFLGLEKPFESYSPRSRRRYIAGAKRGLTAEGVRAEERDKTRDRLVQRGELPAWLERLRDTILGLGIQHDILFSDEAMLDYWQTYGDDYMRTVLTEQIESTRAYMQGSVQPGRTRWNAQGSHELDALIRKLGGAGSAHLLVTPTAYYFYHGRSH